MRVYISADMEGATGVTHPEDVIPSRTQYERFRGFLTADVNAAIEGAAQGGATKFLVNDLLSHDLESIHTVASQRYPQARTRA